MLNGIRFARKKFSEELIEYMENCKKFYTDEVYNGLSDEVKYLSKIFSGPQAYKGLYPSEFVDGVRTL